MASPVAHSLAGAIIYLASRRGGDEGYREMWWLILAANLADFDLIPGLLLGDHALFHRTFSHSISGSVLFALIVYTICSWHGHRNPARITALMFAAYASQLLLDWLSLDPGPVSGIPLFWPFSQEHYMADPVVFLSIERDHLLSPEIIIQNIKAVALETALLAPPAVLLWWWRRNGGSLS